MHLSYSVNEVIELTGIGRTKLYELINIGELKVRKLGRKSVILRQDLEAFLNSLPAYEPRSVEGQTNG